MGILSDFERRLEGLIEGVFTKAFRTGVHPRELATRILRELDAHKTVGVRQVWVPNRFVFRLSPADHERFQQTEKVLRRELEQVIRDGADERGWDLVGPPEVVFEIDPGLRQGEFECEAALVEGPTGPAPVANAAGKGSAKEPTRTPAKLVVIERGRAGKAFELTKDRVIIGRLPESDVAVPDPGVSRRHAEIRQQDGQYVLVDLGSTNGTKVNKSQIDERVLEEGDRIAIGRTVLEFRRG
jgi:hypothetical protein